MLISEKGIMVTYPFLSCYVNKIPSSSSHIKIREILWTDYTECTHSDQVSLLVMGCLGQGGLPLQVLLVWLSPHPSGPRSPPKFNQFFHCITLNPSINFLPIRLYPFEYRYSLTDIPMVPKHNLLFAKVFNYIQTYFVRISFHSAADL